MRKNKLLTYHELIRLQTFEERFEYLRVGALVGDITFGGNRYLNQTFYRSRLWKSIRDKVIVRDLGCDLAHEDYPIPDDQMVVIHHLNPITEDDILNETPLLVDPEFLILTTDLTHKAIHYGDAGLLPKPYVPRSRGDTCPWFN